MNVLALDTSMGACSVAVLRTEQPDDRLFSAYQKLERGHAEALVPMIAQVMNEAQLEFSDLDRLAVTSGPGTFTGVRIGVATARGLALASKLPVVSATSLRVMARTFLGSDDYQKLNLKSDDVLAVVSDARRDEVYVQLFDIEGRALSEPQALAAEMAVSELPDVRVIALGSGGAILASAASDAGRMIEVAVADLQPDASALARLAIDLPEADGTISPCYLRPADAKPQIGKSIERVS